MGLDHGTKTIGIAISDDTRLIASPLMTIKRGKFTENANKLFQIYDENNCTAMIIGWPINMDASVGRRAQSVKDFCNNLLALRDLPILLWDERMSSMATSRSMLEADMSRAKRSKNIDKLAASYILQGVLDRLKTV